MALATLVLAACAQPRLAPPASVGMANPASVYCNEIGGKLRMENTVQGQEGICILPNGTEMEEWTLYRKDHPAK
jgi:putative hemolysin